MASSRRGIGGAKPIFGILRYIRIGFFLKPTGPTSRNQLKSGLSGLRCSHAHLSATPPPDCTCSYQPAQASLHVFRLSSWSLLQHESASIPWKVCLNQADDQKVPGLEHLGTPLYREQGWSGLPNPDLTLLPSLHHV